MILTFQYSEFPNNVPMEGWGSQGGGGEAVWFKIQ